MTGNGATPFSTNHDAGILNHDVLNTDDHAVINILNINKKLS